MVEMRAKDAAKRPSPEARLAALLAEARDVVALLEGYVDWKAGRPSPKTLATSPSPHPRTFGDVSRAFAGPGPQGEEAALALDNAERTDPEDTGL